MEQLQPTVELVVDAPRLAKESGKPLSEIPQSIRVPLDHFNQRPWRGMKGSLFAMSLIIMIAEGYWFGQLLTTLQPNAVFFWGTIIALVLLVGASWMMYHSIRGKKMYGPIPTLVNRKSSY